MSTAQIFRLTAARVDADMPLSRIIALSCLASVGYARAAGATTTNAWSEYRNHAVALQTEIRDVAERLKAFAEFHASVRAEISGHALRDIARGLGLTRFDDGKSDAEGNTQQVKQALNRADNYHGRITRCWAVDVLLKDDWSATKATGAAKDKEGQIALAKRKAEGLRPHELLQNAGSGIANVVKLAAGEDSKIDAGIMTVAAKMLNNINAIIAAATQGMISADILTGLADDVNVTFQLAIGEADKSADVVTLPDVPQTAEVVNAYEVLLGQENQAVA